MRTVGAQLIPLSSNLELPEPDSCTAGGEEREQVIVFCLEGIRATWAMI